VPLPPRLDRVLFKEVHDNLVTFYETTGRGRISKKPSVGPQSVAAPCSGVHDCVAPPFDEIQASSVDDLRADGLRMTR
jgi:hypothetical protein